MQLKEEKNNINDIQINLEKATINCRAAGFITRQGKVLLHKKENDDFWALVGGKVKCMETSGDAILRELKEELGVEVRAEKLLMIAENFFVFDEKRVHQFCFIYKIDDCDNKICYRETFRRKKLIYRWFDINEIAALDIKPEFIKPFLLDMPIKLQHIVFKENDI